MHRRQQYKTSKTRVGVGIGLMGMCILGYIIGPPLYWKIKESFTTVRLASSSCLSCQCDCSSEPLFYIPEGFGNNSITDCMRNDPDSNNFANLMSEEVRLKEAISLENQHRGDIALLEAKKIASQYQKDADKCNSGMETCEEARERAEATLEGQRKMSAMWELRARERGWKDELLKSRAFL